MAELKPHNPGFNQINQIELYRKWYQRVVMPPPNDYLIVVSASSKTPVSGSGKTTVITTLCKELDYTKTGFNAEKHGTVDAGELAYKILPNTKDGHAIAYPEAQGLPGSDSVNKRRGMTNEAIDAINAILGNRDKQFTIVIDAQQLWMLDKSFYPMIDAWLLIRREPSHPKGAMMTHYDVEIDDYRLDSPKIKTPFRESLSWKPIKHSDKDYKALEAKKQKAKRKHNEKDEDKELSKEKQAQIAQDLRNNGKTLRWISENMECITYSRNWISEHTENPNDNKEKQNA